MKKGLNAIKVCINRVHSGPRPSTIVPPRSFVARGNKYLGLWAHLFSRLIYNHFMPWSRISTSGSLPRFEVLTRTFTSFSGWFLMYSRLMELVRIYFWAREYRWRIESPASKNGMRRVALTPWFIHLHYASCYSEPCSSSWRLKMLSTSVCFFFLYVHSLNTDPNWLKTLSRCREKKRF